MRYIIYLYWKVLYIWDLGIILWVTDANNITIRELRWKIWCFLYLCKYIKRLEMKTTDINMNLVDSYYKLLKSLSSNNKLELIARLLVSMKTTKKKNENISLDDWFGSWVSDQSADELVDELKKARSFNRQREALWKNIFSTQIFVSIFWRDNFL